MSKWMRPSNEEAQTAQARCSNLRTRLPARVLKGRARGGHKMGLGKLQPSAAFVSPIDHRHAFARVRFGVICAQSAHVPSA